METVIKQDTVEIFLSKANERGTLKKVIDDERMVTVPYNAGLRFPSFCMVVDDRLNSPTKGREVMIRYSASEASIWVDEQYEKWDLQQYKLGNIKCTPIYFIDGRLRVDAHDETQLDFLRKCRFNKKNSQKYNYNNKTFFEFNAEESAENYIANTEKEFKLEKQAREMDFDKALATVRVSGEVRHQNELLQLSPKEIRWYLIRLSKRDSNLFESTIEDNYLHQKYDILTATDMNVLAWTGQYNDVLADAKTGDVICKAEQGSDKLTFAARYLQEKSPETYSAIRRKIGRGEINSGREAKDVNDLQDLMDNGSKDQLADAFINWHKDKENDFKIFDQVSGADIKFNDIHLIDNSGKRGYAGAKGYLLLEENSDVFQAIYEKWVTQVNSK